MPGLPFHCSARRLGRHGLVVAVMVALAGVRAGSVDPSPSVPGWGSWQAGKPVPIGVAGGRATFEVPCSGPGSRTLVIVSALAKGPGPFAIRLAARGSTGADGPRPSIERMRVV